jgi:hypothetical protein
MVIRITPRLISMAVATALLVHSANAEGPAQRHFSMVPFVGCRSDGQVGPLSAPSGKSKRVQISHALAHQLAYYKAKSGFAVLAPRGWYCFGTYGSGGDTLFLSSQSIGSATLSSTGFKGFDGPAVQITRVYGDTSGRFGVAKMIARLFPNHEEFLARINAENLVPTGSFPSGPYPADEMTYKTRDIVEYQTPPQKDGLGTDSKLQRNGRPIRGVVLLMGQAPDLVHLSVRLTPELDSLASVIIKQVEHDAVAGAR